MYTYTYITGYWYSTTVYNSGCSNPYNGSNCSKNPMPVTTVVPAQKALAFTTVPDTQAILMPPALTTPTATNLATITETEHEFSVPGTVLAAKPTTNESQLGASYLTNHIHQVVQNTNVSMCSSNSYAQENLKNLKSLLDEKLNNKVYNTFKKCLAIPI